MWRALPLLVLVACTTTKPAATTPTPTTTATGPDAEAETLIATILAPEPPAEAFEKLYALMPTLSAAEHAKVVSLGTDPKAPIHVPDIGSEYKWANSFDCGGQPAANVQQALIEGPAGELDELAFDCPDHSHHAVYYDFSADPQEKAMRQELGGKP